MNRSDGVLPPTLFLHGGPGLSAGAERAWLGDELGIDWWDQPRCDQGEPEAYTALLNATRDRLARTYVATQTPVKLLASSFGCNLAIDMARTAPEQIDSIVLLAPVMDVHAAFTRFAAALGVIPDLSGPDERARFWTLVGQVMAVPRFTDRYWNPDAIVRQQQFFELMSDPANFDFSTYRQGLNEFLDRPADRSPTGFAGPVLMVSGQFDPLACVATDEAAIRRLFPQLETILVPAGHFPHLELAPEIWLTMP